MFAYTFFIWRAFIFRRKLHELGSFWSTLPKLKTYDIDVNITGLRTSYDRPNFCYHAELHLPIAYQYSLPKHIVLAQLLHLESEC